jgi:hypothetical protein
MGIALSRELKFEVGRQATETPWPPFLSRGSADSAPGANHGNGVISIIEVVQQIGLHIGN